MGSSAVGFSALILLLVMLVAAKSCLAKQRVADAQIPNPSCTLRTTPAGARILARCHDRVTDTLNDEISKQLGSSSVALAFPTSFEVDRGVTPLTKQRLSWIAEDVTCEGTLIARLPGYVDTPVSSPLEGMGCMETTVQLEAAVADSRRRF